MSSLLKEKLESLRMDIDRLAHYVRYSRLQIESAQDVLYTLEGKYAEIQALVHTEQEIKSVSSATIVHRMRQGDVY